MIRRRNSESSSQAHSSSYGCSAMPVEGQKCFAVGALFVVIYLSVAMVSRRRKSTSSASDLG